MDPYELLGVSRTSSDRELKKEYEEKLASCPDESEERTEIERAYVVIKYERSLQKKPHKVRNVVLASLLVVSAGAGTFYLIGEEPQEKSEKPVETSFVLGEEEKVEAGQEEAKKTSKAKDEGRDGEVDRAEVMKMSEIFFKELEDALTSRSVEGLSASTASYNTAFQSSLDDLKTGDYIFDGELSVRPIAENDVKIDGKKATATVTVDYSSRSYQPYLHERPPASTIVWKLDLIKDGADWLVSKRTSVSDSATGRGMDVRDIVKEDIVSTISSHAEEWGDAYEEKDTGYFTHFTTKEYLDRQRSYYATMNADGVYWEGYLENIEYSPSSIKVSEVATSLTATVEALAHYDGDYYNEDDGSLNDPDDGQKTTFRYHLQYAKDEGRWYITGTDKLKGFTAAETEYY